MFRKIARKRAIFFYKIKVFRKLQFQNIFNIKCKDSAENARCFCQAEYITEQVIK